MVNGKYILSLNDFSPEHTLKRYGLWENDYDIIEEDIYTERTCDILQEKSNRYQYFLDSKKNRRKMWLHMVDFARNGPLPSYTDIPCMWCREPFITCPLGIPVTFWDRHSRSRERQTIMDKCRHMNMAIDDSFEFFETDGVYCSFPCMKAQIMHEYSNPRYKNSFALLTLLYIKLFDTTSVHIPVAPSWKLLKRWGGHMTIEEWRSSFDRIVYEETVNVMQPIMFPIATLHEEIALKAS